MPLLFLEQLPLPSLQSYAIVSLLLFISSFLYAFNVTTSSDQETLFFSVREYMTQDSFCFWVSIVQSWNIFYPLRCEVRFNVSVKLGSNLSVEHFFQQSNLNMAYCCLFLFGKVIQRLVFGDIRPSELQVRNITSDFSSKVK